MMKRLSTYSFMISFVWLGFVGAISFLEAPVKFTAPSLTLAIGLDVGRHVFAALNKAEIAFSLLLLVSMIIGKPSGVTISLFGSVVTILLLQSLWLLPILDARALIYISGKTPPASQLHLVYVGVEALKLLGLLGLGLAQIADFKRTLLPSALVSMGKL